MSSSESEDDVAINAAHAVQGNRLSAATASQYSRHLDSFKSWIESSWRSDAAERQQDLALVLSDSREFVLPMRVDVVEMFLGYLSSRRVPVRPRAALARARTTT